MLKRTCLLISLLLVCPVIVTAQENLLPIILDVTENIQGTQITINGTGFGSKLPKVLLGTTALTVTQSSNTAITANLPPATPAGAYLLTVQNSETSLLTIFTADIGQIGPVGPQGPAGPTGPMGASWPSWSYRPCRTARCRWTHRPGWRARSGWTRWSGWSAGQQGAAGPIGPAGAQGPVGAIGPAGPQGVPGPVGSTGPQGAPRTYRSCGTTRSRGPLALLASKVSLDPPVLRQDPRIKRANRSHGSHGSSGGTILVGECSSAFLSRLCRGRDPDRS